MTGTVKELVGHSLFASGIHNALLKNAGVVVAFHHVRDTHTDPLSIGAAMFERYCRFFQQHFHVVSLPELVSRLERGDKLNHELAITFDDGYLDNYEIAAPILERYSLPATFFVVTQWLGSRVIPWWDREDPVPPEWMTWDQARSLQRRGFDVGGHTRTHCDLGSVSGATAFEEILGSRLELEAELGTVIESFAYPYGGRHNMTEANRELVREAGYRCCCCGFGGENAPGADPYHINRVAITSWYASPHQFGFDVALGMSFLAI